MKKIMIIACMALAGCASDSDNGPSAGKDFPQGTQWVGVLDRAGFQYAPPATLRFKDDNKLVIYSPAFFIEGDNFVRPDSLNGVVTSVTEVDASTVEVKTDVEHYGVLTMTIKDKQKLTAISQDASKPVPFTLEIYDPQNFSLIGTVWSGPVMTGTGPTVGMVAYPDLSTINFAASVTTYKRGGVIATHEKPGQPKLEPIESGYKRIGAAVFMYGYDESNMYSFSYFGVLLPGNTKMMVYSGVTGARLPYYAQTIPWYGPIGQTPIIERQ